MCFRYYLTQLFQPKAKMKIQKIRLWEVTLLAPKHPARPNLFTLFHSIFPLLIYLLDKEFPRTNHLSLCTLRSWHRTEADYQNANSNAWAYIPTVAGQEAKSRAWMPLATLPYWVNHIVFILSHPPDCPAKETSALLSPPTHWLCSLNGRCFPAQRNREHIAGNEDEGRSQLPPSGLD